MACSKDEVEDSTAGKFCLQYTSQQIQFRKTGVIAVNKPCQTHANGVMKVNAIYNGLMCVFMVPSRAIELNSHSGYDLYRYEILNHVKE